MNQLICSCDSVRVDICLIYVVKKWNQWRSYKEKFWRLGIWNDIWSNLWKMHVVGVSLSFYKNDPTQNILSGKCLVCFTFRNMHYELKHVALIRKINLDRRFFDRTFFTSFCIISLTMTYAKHPRWKALQQ